MNKGKNGDPSYHKPTRHHIIPRSRGGNGDKNIIVLPKGIHELWHKLFGNLTPAEAKKFIDQMFGLGRNDRIEKLTAAGIYQIALEIQIATHKKERVRKVKTDKKRSRRRSKKKGK